MIQERNYSISLDKQINQIRTDISNGKDEFPIDIVDTIENDNQLYYEEVTGYWEKNFFNNNGDMVGYASSIGVNFGDVYNEKDLIVYLVNPNKLNIKNHIFFKNACDDDFIDEAKHQGMIFTIDKFQDVINNGMSIEGLLIRFIK